MAVSSKTFFPDGTWTYSGDVSLVSGTAQLTANLEYDADTGGANIDLSAHPDGTSLTTLGWTNVIGGITKETVSGTAVIQHTGAWGGSYVTGSSLEDGAVVVKLRLATGSRWNPFMRWTSGVQSGYVTQLIAGSTFVSQKLGAGLVSIFDLSVNSVTSTMALGNPIDPSTGKIATLNTFTEADGSIRERAFMDSILYGDKTDQVMKSLAGHYGIQSFNTATYDYFKVYKKATGTATTATLTPLSVTTWGQISVDLENTAVTRGSSKLSDLFTYKMIGGTPSPSVHTAIPDDGDISAATGNSIEIKFNPDNRYAAHLNSILHSISIELQDGAWDTPSVTVPGEVTGLTLVSQTATDVSLSWTNGANTTSLEIMRATVTAAGLTGEFNKINDATVTGTTYTDNAANSTPDPVAGTSYVYSIKPLNSTTAGDWSNTVIATFVTAVTRIPGDIEGDLPTEFLNTDDFAEDVIYTAFGGSPVTIKAMYDAESTTVDPETGEIRSSNPLVTVATKNVESASNRDTFTISGQVFRVREVMPDGSGLTVIELTKDK